MSLYSTTLNIDVKSKLVRLLAKPQFQAVQDKCAFKIYYITFYTMLHNASLKQSCIAI